MLPLETITLFVLSAMALALVPGPDNLFVLTQSITKSARAGIAVTLGLMTGLIFHTTAVALGVAAIFQTSQVAFDILKYIGAAYLLYLAYLSFRDSSRLDLHAEKNRLSLSKLYRRGIFMNITNPKVSLFFLALLPQFADAHRGSVTVQIFMLGGLFILSAFIVFVSISLLAAKISAWFIRTPKAHIWLNRIAGSIFVVLAGKLALIEK